MSWEGVTWQPLQAKCQKVPSGWTMPLLFSQLLWVAPPSLNIKGARACLARAALWSQ